MFLFKDLHHLFYRIFLPLSQRLQNLFATITEAFQFSYTLSRIGLKRGNGEYDR